MNLCKYKNVLGEPGKGVHSIRLFGVAVFDVIMTFVLAWIINLFVKTNYLVVLLFCFSLGIILHKIFCVDTTIGNLLKK